MDDFADEYEKSMSRDETERLLEELREHHPELETNNGWESMDRPKRTIAITPRLPSPPPTIMKWPSRRFSARAEAAASSGHGTRLSPMYTRRRASA